MKIIVAHNYYKVGGGEDSVVKNEAKLLADYGNFVKEYSIKNDNINSFVSKFFTAVGVPFSYKQYKNILKMLTEECPDIVHVHNYFPLFSPSIFFACKKLSVPVVHTLHNYRAVCPTAILMHNGEINERSVKGASWWTVSKKVYRNSLIGSLSLTVMVEIHKWLGTWRRKIDCYISLTEFSKEKYISAGWPECKIFVKPNFIEDGFGGNTKVQKSGGYALFVGRLSEEKGLAVLLSAWSGVASQLKIIGDGPLRDLVESDGTCGVEYLGLKDKPQVLDLIQNADFIVMPSTCYEGFPMVLVEAFSCGTPALVSKLGSMEEIVTHGVTGLYFEAGNPKDLAEKVQWMVDNPDKAREMGRNARNEYLQKYTPERNYEMLMDIYQQAIDEAKKRKQA